MMVQEEGAKRCWLGSSWGRMCSYINHKTLWKAASVKTCTVAASPVTKKSTTTQRHEAEPVY